jgi:NAD(P)-dependent dehydrogenase (short-subunit alcohol dehydrogenase family)
MQLKPINQQVVTVVGATSGIGRDTAMRFATAGAKVVVAGRHEGKLASLVAEIQQTGGEVTPLVLKDVAVFEEVNAIANQTVEIYGRLDTWVHLPATAVFAKFEDKTPEEFKRVIDVSLMGQVYGAMAALPHLKREGRGALIHVSSMEGVRSLPYQSAYGAAKHGVEGFLQTLRVELQHDQIPISVTSIKPAVVNTPFWDNARTKLGMKLSAIPPYYEPSLVSKAILYVAQHPTRDFLIGDAARILNLLERLSPTLMDALMLNFAFPLQQSEIPKSEEAADNLNESVPENDTIKGSLSESLEIPSLTDWLERHPAWKWGTVASLGVLVVLAGQAFFNQE